MTLSVTLSVSSSFPFHYNDCAVPLVVLLIAAAAAAAAAAAVGVTVVPV